MPKNTHGGPGRGQGRKPLPPDEVKSTYNTRLKQDIIDYLRSLDNAAQTIDDAIRNRKKFREWKRNNTSFDN